MLLRKAWFVPAALAPLTLVIALAGARAQSSQPLDRSADPLPQKSGQSDQRPVAIESHTETPNDAAADLPAPSGALVTADAHGITIRSSDRDFLLNIGADLQVDNRSFFGAGSASLPDTIVLRRARPTISGTVYKYVDFFFRPDFGLGQTVIFDAYVQLNYLTWANLRVGKYKPPVGLERLQSDDDTSFVERGLPTLLAPSRDIGYQLSGNLANRRVSYAVGVFNGVPDNGLSDSAASKHRDYAARLMLAPFQSEAPSALRGMSFGLAGTAGGEDGIALPSYKSFGQNTFVTFASGVASAGHRKRLAPQGTYYLGPFGVLAEYTLSEEGFRKTGVPHEIAFRAWQVEASYVLTGEKKGFTSPTPRHPFDPQAHTWGAFELAGRLGDFSADKGLYNYGFVDPAKGARRAHEWVGGVNWYLNRLLRISLDYGHTNFERGGAAGNRPAEGVILLRFQISFI